MDQDFDRENPKNWKWGIFYVNADDSRMIVPKRNQVLGWTLNSAHPKVWIGLAVLIGLLFAFKLFIR